MATACVLVATYNRADMVQETLDSVLAQTRPADEIIVIDDGSTDNTLEVLSAYGARIRVITQPNSGKSVALNHGLSQTEADYIWIVDDDDLVARDGLQQMEATLESHPDAGFVFAHFSLFRETDDQKIALPHAWSARPEEPNWQLNFLEAMFALQGAMLIRRSAITAVGPFDPRYIRSQDYEMTLRLIKDFDCVYLPEIVFYQRQHEGVRGSATTRFSAAQREQKWFEYDQMLFTWVRDAFPLERFTPSFARGYQDAEKLRATRIQSGAIFANRGLWDFALSDFEAAVAATSTPLTEAERYLIEHLANRDAALRVLCTDKVNLQRFKALYRHSSAGADLVISLTRPILWNLKQLIRDKDYTKGRTLIVSLLGMVGLSGMAGLMQGLKTRKSAVAAVPLQHYPTFAQDGFPLTEL